MTDTLLIVGAGGHGRDIAATARALNIRYRICDDDPALWIPVPTQWDGPWVIGIGDPKIREEMAGRFLGPAATLIDPRSVVGDDIGIGEGTVIGAGCTLLTECTFGRHVHVTYGVNATRAHFDDYATIGPGVTFCGYSHVGRRAYIGAGATIRNKVHIGDDAVVGAGANVVADVTPGATVVGNPAR